jgi:hypothetical protein
MVTSTGVPPEKPLMMERLRRTKLPSMEICPPPPLAKAQ